MANIFKSSIEIVTFVEFEADSIFEKKLTDIFKVNKDCVKVATEDNNAINNCAGDVHKLFLIEVNFVYFSD